MTPRNPWSFFLNFFWSKTCTVMMLPSLTITSNDSFQYGLRLDWGGQHWRRPSATHLDGPSSHRLLAVHSHNGERVRETEEITARELVRRDHC